MEERGYTTVTALVLKMGKTVMLKKGFQMDRGARKAIGLYLVVMLDQGLE
jgi:hypothetical protein